METGSASTARKRERIVASLNPHLEAYRSGIISTTTTLLVCNRRITLFLTPCDLRLSSYWN